MRPWRSTLVARDGSAASPHVLRQRLLSAAILAPIVVLVFLAGEPWLTIAVAVLALAAAHETFRLLTLAGLPGERVIGLVAAPSAVLGMSM